MKNQLLEGEKLLFFVLVLVVKADFLVKILQHYKTSNGLRIQ